MSDERDPKQGGLVPSSNRELAIRSSALVQRGLEALTSQQTRIVRFPTDRSMGTLYIRDQEAEDDWESDVELGEARGNVIVPGGKRLILLVSDEASADLSPLASLNPDDLHDLSLFFSKHVSDGSLVHIQGLTKLLRLVLMGTQVTDAGLVDLQRMTDLQVLYLGRNITDDGLAHIRGLTKLQTLWLEGCSIRGYGLAQLRDITTLHDLVLNCTQVGDAELEHIQGLTNLQTLNLSHTRITDAGLAYLQGLARLEELKLMGTAVAGSGLAYLSGLPALRSLVLISSQINDARNLSMK